MVLEETGRGKRNEDGFLLDKEMGFCLWCFPVSVSALGCEDIGATGVGKEQIANSLL